MRKLSVLINRVECGLSITDDESVFLSEWIDKRKKENDRLLNFMLAAIVVVIIIGLIL